MEHCRFIVWATFLNGGFNPKRMHNCARTVCFFLLTFCRCQSLHVHAEHSQSHCRRICCSHTCIPSFCSHPRGPLPSEHLSSQHSGTMPRGYRTAMFCRSVWWPSHDGRRVETVAPPAGRTRVGRRSHIHSPPPVRVAGLPASRCRRAITSETLNTNNRPSTQCGAFQPPD